MKINKYILGAGALLCMMLPAASAQAQDVKLKCMEWNIKSFEYDDNSNAVYFEIAEAMELELAEYQELLGRVRGTQLIYLEDMGQNGDEGENFLDRHVADAQADPFAQLRDHRLRQALVEAIENLPEREKYVMAMYYEHDMNLKEIAAVLEVTESRISQLHSQAIARLRTKMRLH